jgi:3-phosphoshikimate 1-carboxyvinyltransferase
MPEIIELIAPFSKISASVPLTASKSISNRLLILNAISNGKISGLGYSDSDDTKNLQRCLLENQNIFFVGDGGTTLRFLLAYFASIEGSDIILKGSERLMKRPVSTLIDALNYLGADVKYVDDNPLLGIHIKGKMMTGGLLRLGNSASSQFATALLLSSPNFVEGVQIILPEQFPSYPYAKMTIDLMKSCGYYVSATSKELVLKPTEIERIQIHVEKDWSSASYWYGITALSEGAEVVLEGLSAESLQGDARCADLFSLLGVRTSYVEQGVKITNCPLTVSEIALDISDFPDLFPALAFSVAGKRMKVYFTGLSTLRVKESDRVFAVTKELEKVNVKHKMLEDDLLCLDASDLQTHKTVIFDTHQDHRIAMSAAMLSCVIWKVCIRSPFVIEKSYPSFWQHLALAGFSVNEFES